MPPPTYSSTSSSSTSHATATPNPDSSGTTYSKIELKMSQYSSADSSESDSAANTDTTPILFRFEGLLIAFGRKQLVDLTFTDAVHLLETTGRQFNTSFTRRGTHLHFILPNTRAAKDSPTAAGSGGYAPGSGGILGLGKGTKGVDGGYTVVLGHQDSWKDIVRLAKVVYFDKPVLAQANKGSFGIGGLSVDGLGAMLARGGSNGGDGNGTGVFEFATLTLLLGILFLLLMAPFAHCQVMY